MSKIHEFVKRAIRELATLLPAHRQMSKRAGSKIRLEAWTPADAALASPYAPRNFLSFSANTRARGDLFDAGDKLFRGGFGAQFRSDSLFHIDSAEALAGDFI